MLHGGQYSRWRIVKGDLIRASSLGSFGTASTARKLVLAQVQGPSERPWRTSHEAAHYLWISSDPQTAGELRALDLRNRSGSSLGR